MTWSSHPVIAALALLALGAAAVIGVVVAARRFAASRTSRIQNPGTLQAELGGTASELERLLRRTEREQQREQQALAAHVLTGLHQPPVTLLNQRGRDITARIGPYLMQLTGTSAVNVDPDRNVALEPFRLVAVRHTRRGVDLTLTDPRGDRLTVSARRALLLHNDAG